jgi:hypothetical protein
MSGYCKDCGNQHCVCDDMKKCNSSTFEEEVYKALGWQGGTIHQVVSEIKRLKEMDTSTILLQLVEIIIKESSVCEPDVGYKLKDVIDDNCLNCTNAKICKFLIDNRLA